METRLSPAQSSALLGLFSLLLYASTLTYGFIAYDDQAIVLGQPHLFQAPFWSGLQAIFTDLPREEPLIVRDLTWLVDSHLFGFDNPLGYHLGNVVLNALNTALVYLFLRGATRKNGLALVVTFLFAILPVHVEPVCWVMGRKDVLSAFFILLALNLQNRMMDDGRHPVLYALTFLFIGCAILSKISAAPAFALLFLHRVLRPYLAGERRPDAPFDWRSIGRHAAMLVPHAVLSIALTSWYRGTLADYGLLGRGPPPLSVQHLTTLSTYIPLVLLENARLLFFPTELQLFYDSPAVGRSPSGWRLGAAFLVTGLLLGALLYTARRRKDLFFHLAAAAVLIVPYLNLIYIGIWLGNRYLYLIAAFGLACVATVAAEIARRPVRIAIGTAYALFLMAGTAANLPVWHDNASLWEHEVALSEPSMLAFSAYARVQVRRAEKAETARERDAAIAAAEEAVSRGIEQYEAMGVEKVEGYANYQRQYLAKLYHFHGRIQRLKNAPLEEQLRTFLKAYELSPSSRLHNMSLAETYFKLAFTNQGERRAELGRKSLAYFERYAQTTLRNAAERQGVARMLRQNYSSKFPELSSEIAAVRERLEL